MSGNLIEMEMTEEPPIVLEGRIDRVWDMIWTDAITIRLIKLFVSWVPNEESIGC